MKNQSAKPPQTIDLYDFDHTIYDGDSSLHFYFFAVGQKPTLLRYLPAQVWHFALFALKLEDRTTFKSNFFRFLRGIGNTDTYVVKFWDRHLRNIKEWYAKNDHSRDVIISASPEFLLRPVADKLQVHTLIATRMDPKTGQITGKNCRAEEKVVRLREVFSDPVVNKAYTDHQADKPILALAKEKYLVKGNQVIRLR